MATQIVRIELNVADGDLSLVWVDRWVCLGEAIRLQHVEQRSFPGVIESQEDYVGRFLEEARPGEHRLKKIVNEHFVIIIFKNITTYLHSPSPQK